MKRSELIRKIQAGFPLNNMDLSGYDFSHANLSGADFQGSNLSGADFSYCNLSGAKFQKANLSGANFQHAVIAGVTMVVAKIAGIPLGNVNHTYFRTAILMGADFSFAKIEKADLVDSDLSNCIFEGAFLRDCEMGRSILSKSNFSNSEIQNCDFSRCSGKKISASKCSFLTCAFPTSDFTGADFLNCEFNNCLFTETIITESKLRHVRFTDCDFSLCYGQSTEMLCNIYRRVTFDRAMLSGSHWEDCSFTNTTFIQAFMADALVKGTCCSDNFSGATGNLHTGDEK